MAALFQLSYSPFEVVIVCKVNAGALAVSRWHQAQLRRTSINEQSLGQKVATVEFAAVDRHKSDPPGA